MDNLPVQLVGQVEHIPVEGVGLLPQGSQAGLGVGPLQSNVAAVEVAHYLGTGVGLGALPLLGSRAGLGALPLPDTRAGLGAHLLDSRAGLGAHLLPDSRAGLVAIPLPDSRVDRTEQLPHPLQTLLPGHLGRTKYLHCIHFIGNGNMHKENIGPHKNI